MSNNTASLNPGSPETSFFARFKGRIVGLTSILIVLPALINAGVDLYSIVLQLPRTEAEKTNEVLFRTYFDVKPVFIYPIPIKQNNGIVEVEFKIYEKGDVYVKYGNFSQWFPFPSSESVKKKRMGLSFISNAMAQVQLVPKGLGGYQQTDQLRGTNIIRQRVYENGVIETQVIDTRTGEILQSTVNQSTQKHVPIPVGNSGFETPKLAPIDLDKFQAMKKTPANGIESANVSRPVGQDALQAGLAWCNEKDNFFARSLCEYREKSRSNQVPAIAGTP